MTWRAACGCAPVKSNKPSSRTPTAPRSLHGSGRTSPPRRCSYITCPNLQTLNSGSSTATSECWWSVPPYSRRKAPRHAPGTRPPAQPEGQTHNSQTPQSTSGKGFHPRRVTTPQLHHALKRRLPHSAPPSPGARLARAQIRSTQHHLVVAIGPPLRRC
jgi:hypothetical protein